MMRRSRAGGPLAKLAVVAILLGPAVARASDAACSAEEAKKRFDRGLAHLVEHGTVPQGQTARTMAQAGHWPEACAAFEASLACRARASTQAWVAACRERDNKLTDALLGYRRALLLEKNPRTADALDTEIRSHIQDLEQRIPRLVLSFEVPAERLRILLDERHLSAEEIAAPMLVDPGTHRLVANAQGYEEKQLELTVLEGASMPVDLTMTKERRTSATSSPQVSSASPPSIAPALPISTESEPDSSVQDRVKVASRGTGAERTVGMVIGAAGVVSLTVATAFVVRTVSLVEDAKPFCYGDNTCDQPGLDLLQDARRAQTTGLVVGGFGLLALGAGIVLVATHPSVPQAHHDPPARQLTAVSRVVLFPTLTGMIARGDF
jgi:hypothetical protein